MATGRKAIIRASTKNSQLLYSIFKYSYEEWYNVIEPEPNRKENSHASTP